MEIVFDRDLEWKRAELNKKRKQFYEDYGRTGGVWQIIHRQQKRRKDRQEKAWLDWYFQLNEEEGFEELWNKVCGIDNGKEIVVMQNGKQIKRIEGFQPNFYLYNIEQ